MKKYMIMLKLYNSGIMIKKYLNSNLKYYIIFMPNHLIILLSYFYSILETKSLSEKKFQVALEF